MDLPSWRPLAMMPASSELRWLLMCHRLVQNLAARVLKKAHGKNVPWRGLESRPEQMIQREKYAL
jgi:hypothetical protein